jgi:hypothetical protein
MVDSKHEQLNNEEIIKIAAQETKTPYSPEQVLATVVAESRLPNTLVIQEGNTLFVVHRSDKDKSVAVFRALNADVAKNYIQNSIVFVETMKSMGFKTLVTEFFDPTILNIFKFVSLNPPFPNMGYKAIKTNRNTYYVTLNLGSDPGGLSRRNPETKQ